MKLITFLGTAALIANSAYAYDGWSEGKIQTIRIQPTRILINQENATNPGNCPNTDYLYLPQSDSTYHKNMYSMVLTAYAANKTVMFALNGCHNDYPAISQVWGR